MGYVGFAILYDDGGKGRRTRLHDWGVGWQGRYVDRVFCETGRRGLDGEGERDGGGT
jgi:hypothetical protein